MMVGAEPRIHCLTSGVVRGKRAERGPRRYLPGGWAEQTLPVHSFLVEHRAGLCLFDAGQSAQAARPGYISQWHPFLRLARFELSQDEEPAALVRGLGFRPEDVRWVVLSHLHTDHMGGLAPFSRAEIVVSRTEWRRFRGLGGRLRGYLPQHWPTDAKPTLVEHTVDLAGDGSLVTVLLPGHTPGHMGLMVRSEQGGWLLAGDAAHTAEELPTVAPGVDRLCRSERLEPLLSHDSQASTRSRSSVTSSPGLPRRRARTNAVLTRTP